MSGAEVTVAEDAVAVAFDSEAKLQAGIALVAELAGWRVQREVHINGWGRLDLLLSAGEGWSWAVELKMSLVRPRDIRRALQQVDGYRRALPDVVAVFLAAPELGIDVPQYAASYPSIRVLGTDDLLGVLVKSTPANRVRAVADLASMRERLAQAEGVLAAMDRRAR